MTSAEELKSLYHPKRILLFCGKRKSGKDFLTDQLQEELSPQNQESPSSSVIIRLSGPLKKCYADNHGLNYQELLSAGAYKEKHRLNMIKWSEELRNKDYGYFCRASLKMYQAEKFRTWIISDCRRKTDFKFFEELFPESCRRIRVSASEEVRKQRGFEHQPGVDDAESECGLDDVQDFHYRIANNGDQEALKLLEEVIKDVQED